MGLARREFCKNLITMAGLVALRDRRSVAQSTSRRPNILLVYTDDQSHRTVGCYEEARPWVKTPNIDRIAAEGVRFVHGYGGTWCLPARASMLTGLLPHSINGLDTSKYFENLIKRDPELCRYWPADFRKGGYTTAIVGKWHLGSDAGHGREWDHSVIWNHTMPKEAGRYYLNQKLNFDGGPFQPVGGYSTDNYTKYATEFIAREHSKPWFLFICYDAVHPPYTPAPRHEHEYDAAKSPVPLPPDLYPPRPGKPAYMQGIRYFKPDSEGRPSFYGTTLEERDRQYNRTALALDEGIGTLYKALQKTGQLENTVIVFTSDQGHAMGHHGFHWKTAPYDDNLRIPFIVRMPQGFPKGKVCRHPVSHLDLVPTFFELSKVPLPWLFAGHSLIPILRKPEGNWPHPVMLEHFRWSFGKETDRALTGDAAYKHQGDQPAVPWWLFLREGKYKYIRTLIENEIEELYDVEADPHEMANLALSPKYKNLLKTFREKLMRELIRTEAPLVKNLPKPKMLI